MTAQCTPIKPDLDQVCDWVSGLMCEWVGQTNKTLSRWMDGWMDECNHSELGLGLSLISAFKFLL